MNRPITGAMYAILSVTPGESFHALAPDALRRRSGLRQKAFDRAFEGLMEGDPCLCRDHLQRCFLSDAGRRAMEAYRRSQEAAAVRQITWRYGIIFFLYGAGALGFALWMLIRAFLPR